MIYATPPPTPRAAVVERGREGEEDFQTRSSAYDATPTNTAAAWSGKQSFILRSQHDPEVHRDHYDASVLRVNNALKDAVIEGRVVTESQFQIGSVMLVSVLVEVAKKLKEDLVAGAAHAVEALPRQIAQLVRGVHEQRPVGDAGKLEAKDLVPHVLEARMAIENAGISPASPWESVFTLPAVMRTGVEIEAGLLEGGIPAKRAETLGCTLLREAMQLAWPYSTSVESMQRPFLKDNLVWRRADILQLCRPLLRSPDGSALQAVNGALVAMDGAFLHVGLAHLATAPHNANVIQVVPASTVELLQYVSS
ncbi:hypothetical protein [Streptomyces sp. SLBN-115]|uniref:hypothetical protein n=1 Tax=Streptomyces sp. SLBN-115 TaxID=2768453 RepID=UPI0011521FC5|nr:hypothetical protein [Streptomyces sp. SLBN-115]TQJ53945.1 hypothetical protein FBY34_1691 [Streptomyces sp. SLBN-115]